jgi:hypothetical protein
MHRLSTTLVKVPSARDAGEDVAVGSYILMITVLQGDPAQTGDSFAFRVGQMRQIRAAMLLGRRSQDWLSEAVDDASALMFCSPGAAVDAAAQGPSKALILESGRLLLSEEPAEYYGLKQMEHKADGT